ncbi:MAG: glycosyltransferase family 2 protein [Rhizobiales bacterium]|nr:glycosyltransferase family 2 protein [Hyphomicrobiales bacterium]OJY44775.1 MAG: hypothetical protein BGP08_00300 [Rhizobiales bacterium 64-17]
MMLATVTLVLIVGIAGLLPLAWMAQANRFLRRSKAAAAGTSASAPAAVILPLRGAEATLQHTLAALSVQNYQDYIVHIVIDNDDDPAWSIVRDHLASSHGGTKIVAQTLRLHRPTCSLKLSAQLQALRSLDPRFEIVVFVDADAKPEPHWLRIMTEPFSNPAIGLVSGIRWYWPKDPTLGDLARHAINACAFPIMHRFNIPWGGSMAVRRSALDAAKLPALWRYCFGEDTSCYGPIAALGLRMETVPAATLFNRETISLRDCFRFFVRQFLSVRLHQTGRRRIFLLNTIAFAGLTLACLAVPLGPLLGQPWLAAGGGLIATLYIAGMILGVRCIERNLPRPSAALDTDWPMRLHRQLASVIPALAIAIAALCASMCAKTIVWRGIRYDVTGKGSVRMRDYAPYRARPSGNQSLL